ncbi:MAG: DUF72 domain-containing protein [Proteobacteria bacterium]|nr:DUF72 domain-containing protein [Pseudomonadota bacterium]
MDIKIGTSGFSFGDWLGTVYPKEIKRSDMLNYYVNNFPFNALEINVSYYKLIGKSIYDSFVKKTPDKYEFIVKAYKGITHDVIERGSWKFNPDYKVIDIFYSSLGKIRESGKLGGILFQFPPYYFPKKDTITYLKSLKDKTGTIPFFVEFRNKYWESSEYINFMKDNDINLCTVDLPDLGKLPRYAPIVTGSSAYFRFHGRNKNWYDKNSDRYDYLYSKNEILKFKDDIIEITQRAKKTFAFFNNCHAGKAVINAKMLLEDIGDSYRS